MLTLSIFLFSLLQCAPLPVIDLSKQRLGGERVKTRRKRKEERVIHNWRIVG
jgi:hypothetical protein